MKFTPVVDDSRHDPLSLPPPPPPGIMNCQTLLQTHLEPGPDERSRNNDRPACPSGLPQPDTDVIRASCIGSGGIAGSDESISLLFDRFLENTFRGNEGE